MLLTILAWIWSFTSFDSRRHILRDVLSPMCDERTLEPRPARFGRTFYIKAPSGRVRNLSILIRIKDGSCFSSVPQHSASSPFHSSRYLGRLCQKKLVG